MCLLQQLNALTHLLPPPAQMVIYGPPAQNIFTLLKIKHYTGTVSLNLHKRSTMPIGHNEHTLGLSLYGTQMHITLYTFSLFYAFIHTLVSE